MTCHLLIQALELFPKDSDCLVARAACNLHLGDYVSTISDAEKALKVNPRQPKVSINSCFMMQMILWLLVEVYIFDNNIMRGTLPSKGM